MQGRDQVLRVLCWIKRLGFTLSPARSESTDGGVVNDFYIPPGPDHDNDEL
jgi:hypothetical protein